jgi:hypothetical protein
MADKEKKPLLSSKVMQVSSKAQAICEHAVCNKSTPRFLSVDISQMPTLFPYSSGN